VVLAVVSTGLVSGGLPRFVAGGDDDEIGIFDYWDLSSIPTTIIEHVQYKIKGMSKAQ
jgi:hypothetical protein